MTKTALSDVYREYIACLNQQNWSQLDKFVDAEVSYNAQQIGISKYQEMLQHNWSDIPDLYFNIQMLICDPPHLAARLGFDCTPKGKLLELPINGRRVLFSENVFYKLQGGKIVQVWSIIDKAAIEAQLPK